MYVVEEIAHSQMMFTPLTPKWGDAASKRASFEQISLRSFSAAQAKWIASAARSAFVAGKVA